MPDTYPDADARKAVVANYRTIVKGLHAYHDVARRMPAGIATGPVVGLSWRVQVLPYIGQKDLYGQFKLTEPWDSAHNKRLLERMPQVFAAPGADVPKGHTFVRITHGTAGVAWTVGEGLQPPRREPPGTPVDGRPLAAFFDGLSNTVLFAEGRDAVPWTKPDELPMSLATRTQPPPLGGAFADGFHAVFADGAIAFYKSDYPAEEVAKMFTPASGEAVNVRGVPDRIGYFLKSDLKPPR